MTESDARTQAAAEARFLTHLGVYALFAIALAALHLLVSGDVVWSLWGALVWGLAVLGHGAMVYGGRGTQRGQRRRARALRGGSGLSETDVHRILNETLQVEALPMGTAQMLSQLQRRVEALEGGPPLAVSGDGADPFDMGALHDALPASTPEPPADLFANDRSPIDTPRYDSL